jgi:hypothetical protein
MKCYPLTNEEILAHNATHKIVIPYTDLTGTAALTKTTAIYPFSGTAPIGTLCRFAKAYVRTAFVGCATLTLQVGDGGDTDRNLAASDMKATAGTFYAAPATANAPFAAADTLDALFTATTDNLSSLSAGEVEIYIQIQQDNRLVV